MFPNHRLAEHHFAEIALGGTNTTIKSKRPYREFRTLRILIVSMFKHVQNRTRLLISHVGWGKKFGMIECRTTDIPKFQNYEY